MTYHSDSEPTQHQECSTGERRTRNAAGEGGIGRGMQREWRIQEWKYEGAAALKNGGTGVK